MDTTVQGKLRETMAFNKGLRDERAGVGVGERSRQKGQQTRQTRGVLGVPLDQY